MHALFKYFIKNSLLVNLITVVVIMSGIIVGPSLIRAFIPPIDGMGIIVQLTLPGESAVEMERLITFPAENALRGTQNIEKIKSKTTNGATQIILKYEGGLDRESMARVREEVQHRLESIQHLMPNDLLPISYQEMSENQNQSNAELLIHGANIHDAKDREILHLLEERFTRLPYIRAAKLDIPTQNLQITPNDKALAQASLNMSHIRAALQTYLKNHGLGRISYKDQNIAVLVETEIKDISEIQNIFLTQNRANQGITLGQVASVEISSKEQAKLVYIDGKEVAGIGLFWDNSTTDSVDASDSFKEAIKNIQEDKILPEKWSIEIKGDVSEIISHQLSTLFDNGLMGILLILFLLTFSLGLRSSLMTALGLPFCYCGIILVLAFFGMTLNLISLMAMLLVAGIVVDDAIIISEAFARFYVAGVTAQEAALSALQSVWKPVLGMSMTTSVAFIPLLILNEPGLSSIVQPLPVIVISALVFSFFESLFLLPNHLAHFSKTHSKETNPTHKTSFFTKIKNGIKTQGDKVGLFFEKAYVKGLSIALKLRYFILLIGISVLALAFFLVSEGHIKFQGDGINITSQVTLHLEFNKSYEALKDMERDTFAISSSIKKKYPTLIEHQINTLGARGYGPYSVQNWNSAKIGLSLYGTTTQRDSHAKQLEELLKVDLDSLKKQFGLKKLEIQIGKKDLNEVIEVFVSGGDKIDFVTIQDEVFSELDGENGIVNVSIDQNKMQRSFIFQPNTKAILKHGLTVPLLLSQIRGHFSSQELMRFRYNGQDLPVILESGKSHAQSLVALEILQVTNARGMAVPLKSLGTWRERNILKKIDHDDGLRVFKIDVAFDSDKIKTEKVTEVIEQKLEPLRIKHPGYHISVKPSEQLEKTKNFYFKIITLCLLLIYITLVLTLNSLIWPIVVIFAIPFGFSGVVFAFYLQGFDLDLTAVIGVLGLAGIVVNDSLVITSTIGEHLNSVNKDLSQKDAIINGSSLRLRAVLLTTMTTLGGVLPLAYGWLGEAGWLSSMVMAIGWGLLFSTGVTLIFIPSFLMVLEDIKSFLRKALSKIGVRKT